MINDELRIILVFLSSFFGAVFVLPKLAHIARRIGLLDHPNPRKIHITPRPLVGGIGMVIAATFTSLVFIPIAGFRGFFLGISVLLLIGFLDDFKELGHRQKFLAQIGATLLLIYFSKVSLSSFGDLLGLGDIVVPGGSIVVWLVTIFCVVGVINAINLMDGLDGLAGGISFIAFLFFAIHASFGGNHVLMLLNLAFAGAVLGFLRFNWAPSVLFMGDAGSLCLGFTLAFMALALTQGESGVSPPVTALLLLAVPIIDTIVVMSKRIIRGRSPFKPDRLHLHHILMRYGMGRTGAVRVILGISVLIGCLSLLGPVYNIEEKYLFLLIVIFFLVYVLFSFYILRTLRYSHKFRNNRPKTGEASNFLNIALGFLDFFRIFRKSPRYNVNLELVCSNWQEDKTFHGRILDISTTGCMAFMRDMDILHDKVSLSISFPSDEKRFSVKLPAEHIWVFEQDGKYFHGFKFNEFDGEQEQVMFQFMVRLNKKAK